jgi:outer membrane protein assembly factor BamB
VRHSPAGFIKSSRVLIAVSLLAATLAGASGASGASGAAPAPTPIRPVDWRTYGHDIRRSFNGVTTLTPSSVHTLLPAWFFPTGDAVTANPIVVAGTVYAGSWDGNFYAIDALTGTQRWKYVLKRQHAVSPRPGEQPRDPTSDGGLVTSSAWFHPGDGRGRPDLVIFGGGYTLYALVARTGALYWQHDYTGRPDLPANPATDEARIFASPVVVGDRVLFAVTSDGQDDHRGYIAAANLRTGKPVWRFETAADTKGQIHNKGCGGVWSSGTVLAKYGLVVFDVADCHFRDTAAYNERVIALRISDGHRAWLFHPARVDPNCDWDFGATANLGIAADGTPTFLGVGGKDGTYYSLDPRTGRQRWGTNVVFGGLAGGFIATPAYDGTRVIGATALGDFGRFEGFGTLFVCQPGNRRDTLIQEPSLHAFDAKTGKVLWEQPLSQSFSATTIAGGMAFVGLAVLNQVQIRDADNGNLLTTLPLPAASQSGVVVSGNTLLFGTGSSEQGAPTGIYAFTPLGERPSNTAPR